MYSLYVYASRQSNLISSIMSEMWNADQATPLGEGVFRVCFETPPEEPMEAMRELIMSDVEVNLSITLFARRTQSLVPEAWIATALKHLPYDHYTPERIYYYLLKHYPDIRQMMRERCDDVLRRHLVETVLALARSNLNVSEAAEKLFIHRNTMLYRLERVKDRTGIDPQTFLGASIFHLLYTL